MITGIDKAIVALVMAIIQLANVIGFHWGVSEAAVTSIVSFITPLLVYFVPNKGTA